MITIYDTDVPYYLKSAHLYLLVFELILIVPGAVVVATCGYVIFLKAPQFHVHVHIILSSIFIAYFVVTASRIALLLSYFMGQQSFEISVSMPLTVLLDAVRCTAASAVLLSIPILTLERVVATIRIRTYEKERHRLIVLGFLLFCYLGCCGNAYLIVQVGAPLTIFLSFGMVWLVLNLFAFQRLVQWSRDEYEKQMKTSVQPLTVRFQLSENVRLGKILLASLRVFCFAVALGLLIILLVVLITIPYGIT